MSARVEGAAHPWRGQPKQDLKGDRTVATGEKVKEDDDMGSEILTDHTNIRLWVFLNFPRKIENLFAELIGKGSLSAEKLQEIQFFCAGDDVEAVTLMPAENLAFLNLNIEKHF